MLAWPSDMWETVTSSLDPDTPFSRWEKAEKSADLKGDDLKKNQLEILCRLKQKFTSSRLTGKILDFLIDKAVPQMLWQKRFDSIQYDNQKYMENITPADMPKAIMWGIHRSARLFVALKVRRVEDTMEKRVFVIALFQKDHDSNIWTKIDHKKNEAGIQLQDSEVHDIKKLANRQSANGFVLASDARNFEPLLTSLETTSSPESLTAQIINKLTKKFFTEANKLEIDQGSDITKITSEDLIKRIMWGVAPEDDRIFIAFKLYCTSTILYQSSNKNEWFSGGQKSLFSGGMQQDHLKTLDALLKEQPVKLVKKVKLATEKSENLCKASLNEDQSKILNRLLIKYSLLAPPVNLLNFLIEKSIPQLLWNPRFLGINKLNESIENITPAEMPKAIMWGIDPSDRLFVAMKIRMEEDLEENRILVVTVFQNKPENLLEWVKMVHNRNSQTITLSDEDVAEISNLANRESSNGFVLASDRRNFEPFLTKMQERYSKESLTAKIINKLGKEFFIEDNKLELEEEDGIGSITSEDLFRPIMWGFADLKNERIFIAFKLIVNSDQDMSTILYQSDSEDGWHSIGENPLFYGKMQEKNLKILEELLKLHTVSIVQHTKLAED